MSMTIRTHADPATLMSFAAGTLTEPLAAVVAAHVALCGACRREIALMELIGAGLVLDAEPAVMATRPSHRHGARRMQPLRQQSAVSIERGERLPSPIATAYGLSLATVPWKRLGPGVWHHRLPLSDGIVGDLRLLKITAGRRMPEHGHGGAELTLVVEGAYRDETGSYGRGDIQDVDGSTEHMPIADAESGCICLIASEYPARFKGLVARLLQPLTGM